MDSYMEHIKAAGDGLAGVVTIAALFNSLPAILLVANLVYVLVRLWESHTARRLLKAMCSRCANWWEQ